MFKTNIVYKIKFNECDVSYVGQTKRQIRTRIKEHRNNIKLDKTRHSVITDHIVNYTNTLLIGTLSELRIRNLIITKD